MGGRKKGNILNALKPSVLAAFLSIFAATGAAFSEEAKVEGIVVQQVGSSLVIVEVRGFYLPAPQVTSQSPSELQFLWPETTLPSTQWGKPYPFPLVKGVELAQADDGVAMKVFTGEELAVKEVMGKAPANRYFIHLEAVSHAPLLKKALREAPGPIKAWDPMAITTPVTIEWRDMDLRDAIRMLGKITGMNIVADQSVPATTLTMSLKDVPLNEALGYIMRMHDLSYAVMGKTVVFGTKQGLGKVLGKVSRRSYNVAYADPKQVSELIKGMTGITEVAVDERLRTIYVAGSEDQLYEVNKILDRIDHPGRQIMLQSRIIEVRDTNKEELESLVEAVYSHWWLSYGASGGMLGYSSASDAARYGPKNDRTTSPQGIDLKDIAEGGLRVLDAGLRILVEKNAADILASPSIVTIDGQKASIRLTTNYKYISERDDAGNPVYSEEQVGPTLEITPTIGRDGVVTINVNITTGEIVEWRAGGRGEEVPITSLREVKTMVRVRNGELFVIGGLFNERNTVTTTRVPVLSDIPLLGELFKSKRKDKERSEVVAVVVPYILEVPTSSVEMSTLNLR
ncbi:type II secretion system protein GspD [Acetomicrobium sp. S15 = DSM 107314]|uniref:type II secretion system protein GspD n=1 Tax=Acetomicrobium sp. S15 = DSM 107314 TaxID=2529858 RepID=UPI0018E0EE13|nr:secretin N-terminal domain-containing protein [Acetomicrobium sp. S15 = DSM 107314]